MPVDLCPPESSLEFLLAEILPAAERLDIEAHIEDCSDCQKRLDNLLTNETSTFLSQSVQARSGPRVKEQFLESMLSLVPKLSQSSSQIQDVVERRREGAIDLPSPAAIGEYEILGEIGRGGMSVVYKARQPRLGRIVAVKRLRLRDQDAADVARFLREAESIAAVPHPNIVQVFECGDDHGRPYFALEYVPGGSLAEFLDGKPVEARAAAMLVEKVALAIHHAHQHGVIHRDLKPANVLLAGREDLTLSTCTPKVADFGLARRVDDDRGLTQPDMLSGTPAYLAPEQIGQSARSVTAACDIYSLGVLLYEMLIGRPPLQGPTVLTTLRLVETTEPVPPRRLQPHLPRDLETICLMCLRKDPTRRYSSALAVAEDLKRFLEQRPIQARRFGNIETAYRWGRRNPAVASLAFTAFIALGIGIVSTLAFIKEARQNEVVAKELAEQAEINSRLANDRTYFSDLRLANSMWNNNQLSQLNALLDGQRPGRTDGVERRGFEWHYLWRASHPPQRTITKLDTLVWNIAYGNDGRTLAVATGGTDVLLINVSDGKVIRALKGLERGAGRVTWSQTSNRIAATGNNGTVCIWDAATGKLVGEPLSYTQAVFGLDFDPKGQVLATACQDGNVYLWEVGTGTLKKELKGSTSGMNAVVFSRDGRQIAGGSRKGIIQIWNTESGKEGPPLIGHIGDVTCLRFSPDGTLLATGSTDRSIRLWQSKSGQVVNAINHHRDAITEVAFSPDGHWLASASMDNTLRIIDVASNLPLPPLLGHTQGVTSLTFSPDSRKLASASRDQTVREWDFANDAGDRRLSGHTKPITSMATDPRGRFIVSAAENGEIRLWDAGTGNIRTVWNGPKKGVTSLAISPDATLIAAAGADHQIYLWNTITNAAERVMVSHQGRVSGVAFSSDGTMLASVGHDKAVKLWNPRTGELLNTWENASLVDCVAWHPSKPMLAVGGSDGVVTVYDAVTRQLTQRFPAHTGEIHGIAFSPDGRRFATAGRDTTITLWDVDTWSKRDMLRGHVSRVTAVVFGPDSSRIFSSGRDSTVHVWNVVDGQPLLILGEPGLLEAVCISPDGATLYVAGKTGQIRLWKATPFVP
ncbi:hypothetical protein BH11PLA2_BH11PLA2_49230 [soil metagenome]